MERIERISDLSGRKTAIVQLTNLRAPYDKEKNYLFLFFVAWMNGYKKKSIGEEKWILDIVLYV